MYVTFASQGLDRQVHVGHEMSHHQGEVFFGGLTVETKLDRKMDGFVGERPDFHGVWHNHKDRRAKPGRQPPQLTILADPAEEVDRLRDEGIVLFWDDTEVEAAFGMGVF